MKTKLTLVLLFAVLFCAAPALPQRLPEAGLKKAQLAEKQLKADKPQEAIKILEALDKEYPGHGAVSLRLAQVYDQTENYGAALFYYRRYAQIAGSEAIEDARNRVTTLELMAGAAKAAEEFARKRGQESTAVEVPTPEIQRSVEQMAPDGSWVPVTDPSMLGKPVTPITTAPASQRPSRTQRTRQRAVITPIPIEIRESDVSGESMGLPSVRPSPSMDLAPKLEATAPGTPSQAGEREPATPALAASSDESFFDERVSSGDQAQLRLINAMPDSILTFAAVAPGKAPVNIVLMTNESRDTKIAPGRYSITVNITERGYTPTTLLDKRFDFQFRAGNTYTKRLAP